MTATLPSSPSSWWCPNAADIAPISALSYPAPDNGTSVFKMEDQLNVAYDGIKQIAVIGRDSQAVDGRVTNILPEWIAVLLIPLPSAINLEHTYKNYILGERDILPAAGTVRKSIECGMIEKIAYEIGRIRKTQISVEGEKIHNESIMDALEHHAGLNGLNLARARLVQVGGVFTQQDMINNESTMDAQGIHTSLNDPNLACARIVPIRGVFTQSNLEKEHLQAPTISQSKPTRIPIVVERVFGTRPAGAAKGTSTQGAAMSSSPIGITTSSVVNSAMRLFQGTRVMSDPTEDSIQPVLAPDEVTCSEQRRGNILVVGLIDANRLRIYRLRKKPFVNISLGREHFTTPDDPNGSCSNPDWGCAVRFTLPEDEFQLKILKLSFEIRSRGRISRHVRTVGNASVDLNELTGSICTMTLPVSQSGSETGELRFYYEFTNASTATSPAASTATSPAAVSTAITVSSRTNSWWRRIGDCSVKLATFVATVGSAVAAVGTWVATLGSS